MQIVSAVRYTWPQFFKSTPPLWESTPYPSSGVHFVLTDGDVLISHALVTSRPLTHGGETFNVYGLSSVICYPTHRGEGLGERVAAAATGTYSTTAGRRLRPPLLRREGEEPVPASRLGARSGAQGALRPGQQNVCGWVCPDAVRLRSRKSTIGLARPSRCTSGRLPGEKMKRLLLVLLMGCAGCLPVKPQASTRDLVICGAWPPRSGICRSQRMSGLVALSGPVIRDDHEATVWSPGGSGGARRGAREGAWS